MYNCILIDCYIITTVLIQIEQILNDALHASKIYKTPALFITNNVCFPNRLKESLNVILKHLKWAL
jgi:hypothetical protein